MTISDRRLLIELGAVLIIKLILITLIKIYFFSPDPERSAADPGHFFSEKKRAPVSTPVHSTELKPLATSSAQQNHQNKER